MTWAELTKELANWRTEELVLPLWWRDDDAIEETAQLSQLIELAEKISLPVHLAVIPEPATEGLAWACADNSCVVPVVHGWAHRNRSRLGQKKAEFGRPRRAALHETEAGLTRLRALFGPSLFEMFVPPWNRFDVSFAPDLVAQGYVALSTYLPRVSAEPVPGLRQINTHLDPIDWRNTRSLVSEDKLIDDLVALLKDRRTGVSDTAEPLGFLTHHLVHDPAIWAFSERCLKTLLDAGATPCNLLKLKDNLP